MASATLRASSDLRVLSAAMQTSRSVSMAIGRPSSSTTTMDPQS
jgi:hypothetical protein